MSADTIPSEVVDQVADIIDQNELGYSITLTRLVDGIETWTLAMDGETHEFDFREDAAEVVATKRRRLQAARVIEATAAILATRPAEPAAPLAEAGDGEVVGWFCLDLAAGGVKGFTFSESLAKQRDGYRYLGQLAWEVYPVVRLSALEAERARADAAEQRAADALARAEKAERERDAYHDALTPGGDTKALMIGEFFEEIEVRNPDYDDESLDEDEDDEPEFITHRVPVSWTTTKAMMERLRSYAHRFAASREAQAATDGGDNG